VGSPKANGSVPLLISAPATCPFYQTSLDSFSINIAHMQTDTAAALDSDYTLLGPYYGEIIILFIF